MSKPGRNDPCPCGSGKKYKKCCELKKKQKKLDNVEALSSKEGNKLTNFFHSNFSLFSHAKKPVEEAAQPPLEEGQEEKNDSSMESKEENSPKKEEKDSQS